MEGVCSHPRLRLPSGNVVGHGHKGLCNFSRSFFTLIHVSREKEVINLDESIICLCSKDLFLKTWTNHVHNCVAWNVTKLCYNATTDQNHVKRAQGDPVTGASLDQMSQELISLNPTLRSFSCVLLSQGFLLSHNCNSYLFLLFSF